MKLLLLLALLLAGPTSSRQVKESEVKFQIDNAGFPVNGTLSGLAARGLVYAHQEGRGP